MSVDLEFTPERILAIRKKLGETQREFANRIGVTPTAVSLWERGERQPDRRDTLQALVRAEAD